MSASEGKESGSPFCGGTHREASDSEAMEMSLLPLWAAGTRELFPVEGRKGGGLGCVGVEAPGVLAALEDHPSAGPRDQPGQHNRTLSRINK